MKQLAGVIARRYGTALFETVSRSPHLKLDEIAQSLTHLRPLFTKFVLQNLTSHTLSKTEKQDLLDIVFSSFEKTHVKLPKELTFFFQILLENQRISYLDRILQYFLEKSDAKRGLLRASLVSAHDMQTDSVKEFEQALSKVTGKKTVLNVSHDPSLMSGFVVRIGNTQIDASLKARVNNLKNSLH